MDDAVRLSAGKFRAIYEESFNLWSAFYLSALENPGLPVSYLSPQKAFRQHPSFPRGLRLESTKFANNTRVCATGSSTWGSSQTDCSHELPQHHEQLEFKVASSKPIAVSFAEALEPDSTYATWFARDDQNYLPVLIPAWAYILSARWTETMPGRCILGYKSNQPDIHDGDVKLDIGDAAPEDTRWWATVLAPGQGWQAITVLDGRTVWSPWSLRLESGPRFSILSTTAPDPSAAAPSSSDAIRFLDRFCVRHNVVDQSHAALAAVLLLPSMVGGQGLRLPAPIVSYKESSTTYDASAPAPPPRGVGPEHELRHDWAQQGNHLDRLITLSCNIGGIRPMLLSVFYEPSIECNAATPWLQGTVAAMESLVGDKPLVLGRMCMDRSPQVAFLWLGATVLGLQKTLLQDVRFGRIPINLHSALWSGTIQSFIQQPVSRPLVTDGCVSRADECRLLFLSQTEFQSQVPISPWKPFGVTLLGDTDVEIRNHAGCGGHGLQYQGFAWDCVEGAVISQPVKKVEIGAPPRRPVTPQLASMKQVPIFYGNLNREKEFVSENATRSLFGWLRFDGYAAGEKEIWQHRWFKILESDDEDEEPGTSTSSSPKSASHVESWISELASEA